MPIQASASAPCGLGASGAPARAARRAPVGAPPRRRRPAAAAAEPADAGGRPLREQARLLDRLFYAAEASPSSDGATSAGSAAGAAAVGADIAVLIEDLPLWRVQWALLPNFREVLHVHVPHYCDMFARLTEGPRPWMFGHLLTPGGSKSLGDERFALAPGTYAPLVGTLAEVIEAARLPDGRFVVLAVGRGRFEVLRATAATPCARADVAMLPDAEEAAAAAAAGVAALAALGDAAGVGDALRAARGATRAAAAAAARVWADAELADARAAAAGALVDGADEAATLAFSRRIASIGANEFLELPRAAAGGAAAGAAVAAAADAAAEAAALEFVAAAAAAGRDLDVAGPVAALLKLDAGGPRSLNLVAERGVRVASAAPPAEGDAAAADPAGGLPDGAEAAARLFAAAGAELAALRAMAARLGAPGPSALIARLDALLSELDAAGPGAWLPPLRRAQRLSYALASILGDVSPDEGRQALLEAGSTSARLRLGLAALRRRRVELQVALAMLGGGGGEDAPE
jgi:Lon protease-like protein